MKKIMFLFFIVIMFNNLFSQDSTKIVIPLEVGNRWQYVEYLGNFISYENYFLEENQITNDTIINGKRYFPYWIDNYYGSIKYPTRYDYDSNVVYISINDTDRQAIDFRTPHGQNFNLYYPPENKYFSTTMEKGKAFLFGDTITYAGYYFRYHKIFYANKLGLYRANTNYVGEPGGANRFKKIIRAIIYDSLGNFTYYTDSNKCNINYQPPNDFRKDSIEILSQVNHAHTHWGYINNSSVLKINFTDSVWVEYFFRKNEYSSDTIKLALSNIDGTINYKGFIVADSAYLKNGFNLVHRIIAKDKSLIPAYSYTPYYSATYIDSQFLANKIVVPLSVGNRWQYEGVTTGSDNYRKYNIAVKYISKDTTINNKKYYFYWENLPTRYDPDSNSIYIYYQGEEKQIVDFRKNNGEYFKFYHVARGVYDSIRLNRGTNFIIGKSYSSASFAQNVPYKNRYFANGLGMFAESSYSSGPGGGTNSYSEIFNAVIYDSSGNMTYYTDSAKCEILTDTLDITDKTEISFQLVVDHPHSSFGTILDITRLDVNFTDSVWMQYFYEKNNIRYDTVTMKLNNIESTLKYNGLLYIDRDLLNKGFKLKYRICACDKALIPAYTCTDYITAIDNTNINYVSGDMIINYSLEQNYPNPFNPITTIKYSIEKTSNVVVKVFDVLGNEITKLVEEPKERGNYSVDFDATKLASGIYYYSISAGGFYSVKKMVLLK
ncbi:MAG: T9SS type A sorting domain-containing protein [Syntrophothermus sp.]